MVDAMKMTISEEEPKVRASLDLGLAYEKSLPDFVTGNITKLFPALDIPTEFLEMPLQLGTSKMILGMPLTESSLFLLRMTMLNMELLWCKIIVDALLMMRNNSSFYSKL